MKKLYYMGINGQGRIVFSSPATPTRAEYGERFKAVVGPFRTKKGATFRQAFGNNNPHLQTVNGAERLAKL